MRKNKRKAPKVVFLGFIVVLGTILMVVVNEIDSQASSLDLDVQILNAQCIDYKEININDIKNTHEQWLVNSSHSIKNEITENSLQSAYQRIALSRSDIKMNPTALEKMEEMFAAAKKKGIDSLVVTSGYRTKQKQNQLYQQAEDKSYVQIPGCSEHETGLAADIQLESGGMNNLGDTKQGAWLMKNSWMYGYIIRYPKDKVNLTGISYEAWHFRYVGIAHAAFMKTKNLCLEEYIDYLKKNNQYQIKVGDKKYLIYRVTAKNGKIKVPKNLNYAVSDDNCGGYIISVILK